MSRVPFVFMTYVNPILAMGEEKFAQKRCRSGASGVIIPDLPVGGSGQLAERRDASTTCRRVFLAAPTTPQRADRSDRS